MSYLDKYKHCAGCPVSKYCGTMVESVKLCNSLREDMLDEVGTLDERELYL